MASRFSYLSRRLGRILLAAGILGLACAGCVRLLEPRSSNITHYLLDSERTAEVGTTDTTGLRVGLRRPQLASYLDASRIVTRYGANAVRFADNHRWGEDLESAVNRVVALNLERQPGIRTTEVVPWSNEVPFDYVLRLHILHFEGVSPVSPGPEAESDAAPEGHVWVDVQWKILGPEGETGRAEGRTRHREEEWRVGDYAALVARLDTSLVVLADDIGDRLRTLSNREAP